MEPVGVEGGVAAVVVGALVVEAEPVAVGGAPEVDAGFGVVEGPPAVGLEAVVVAAE